ncbi:hypothetical protein HDV63DRAFT_286750 [Trichoderma sp. SZMC 28014]
MLSYGLFTHLPYSTSHKLITNPIQTDPLIAIQKAIYSIRHFICWANLAMSAAEIAAMPYTRLCLLGPFPHCSNMYSYPANFSHRVPCSRPSLCPKLHYLKPIMPMSACCPPFKSKMTAM